MACWLMLGIVLLVVASFASLDLQWTRFWSWDAVNRMGHFLEELLHPETGATFIGKVLTASLETLAMSALGTLLAVLLGLACAAHPSWCGPHCF
jgi:phosphonate transport system permease protein